jgi:hypothetical protein
MVGRQASRQESTHTDDRTVLLKLGITKKVSHTHTHTRTCPSSGREIGGGGVVTELDGVKIFKMKK